MKCRFGTVSKRKPAAAEVWRDPKSAALVRAKARELGKRRGVSLSETELLREAIYQETRWCNFYNPTFCLWLYKTLADQMQEAGVVEEPQKVRILDPSSGWGDRLVAACALGAEAYHGFDPNEELQAGYDQIIARFAPSGSEYHVHPLPFEGEDAKVFVRPGAYHIVHTSPPYFDIEDYPGKGGKTAKDHPKYGEWLKTFYQPYLKQAWRGVAPGGCLAIYVEDVHVPLLKDTQNAVEGLGGKRGNVYGFRQDFDWPESGFKKSQGKVRTAAVWWKPAASAPKHSPLNAKKAASRNLVVDTLNMTHRLLNAGHISRCSDCPPAGLSSCLIGQAIEYAAKKLKPPTGRFDGKVVFVLKDRESASTADGRPIRDACERDYAEVAQKSGVEIHRALKPSGPPPDWQAKGTAGPNHQKLGRDDFYLGFLAWRLSCAALTGDHMRDFQQLKSEVSPFRVQVINQWGESSTDYVNPGAAEYAKMRAPLRVGFSDHGL